MYVVASQFNSQNVHPTFWLRDFRFLRGDGVGILAATFPAVASGALRPQLRREIALLLRSFSFRAFVIHVSKYVGLLRARLLWERTNDCIFGVEKLISMFSQDHDGMAHAGVGERGKGNLAYFERARGQNGRK